MINQLILAPNRVLTRGRNPFNPHFTCTTKHFCLQNPNPFLSSSSSQFPPFFFSHPNNHNNNNNNNNNKRPIMATVEKRKPVFVKVEDLKPGTTGHNLIVKIVNSKPIPAPKPRRGGPMSLSQRPQQRPSRIAECLVGDETGAILFTARNDQVDLMNPGTTVILRNAKIDMFKGSMRLAVDKWGLVQVTEPGNFAVKESNNLSLVEYELVTVQA